MDTKATAARATIRPDQLMPDQSSAATEHAILQEITAPLETWPDDPVTVVNADFPVALRGYDRIAVDAYVQQVTQLVAEMHATRSPEAAVRRALERVGEQISGVLQRAHETAEQITAQSRSEAEDRLETSRIEAAEITASAQQRVSDLDADTDRIWTERHRIVDEARDLARQLTALADAAAAQSSADAPAGQPYADALAGQPDVDAGTAPYDDDPPTEYDDDGPPTEYDDEPAHAEAEAPEDLEQTVAFGPIAPAGEDEPGEAVGSESPPRPPGASEPRPSSSVIPPASQAANRRFSR
jgi:DivIVA domain-containing protein